MNFADRTISNFSASCLLHLFYVFGQSRSSTSPKSKWVDYNVAFLITCMSMLLTTNALSVAPKDRSISSIRQFTSTNDPSLSRRDFQASFLAGSLALPLLTAGTAEAKCTDIESCREIGEKRDQELQKANPIVRLGGGLQYKVLNPGVGSEAVPEVATGAKVSIAYTISQANGSYMYSRGFGYNKIDIGNGQMVQDIGSIDSLLVTLGTSDIPVGIQRALVGMRRGEKRRIECPPSVGFETSDWNPRPTSFRGKQQIKDYQSKLFGRGDTQPAFPAPTIWDVEVLKIYT